jgi:ferrous iron transport protein A
MACPLTFAPSEKELKIVDIQGGEKAKTKLLERGIYIGEHLYMNKKNCGKIILKVRDSKYIIGCGLANKIIVEEV